MIGVSGVLIVGGAQATMIELEMTPEQVMAQRGKPDRIAILEGKLLRSLALEEVREVSGKRTGWCLPTTRRRSTCDSRMVESSG